MNKASFHHVRLNVLDIDQTIAHYQKFYGANPIKYANRADALFTERSFVLLNKVNKLPTSNLGTSLWHIGWSGVDGISEFEWRVREGIKVHTPINPLKEDHWMYFYGPNQEVVEIFTGNRNHRFEHIHLLAADVDVTVNWFKENIGVQADYEVAQPWSNNLFKWNKMHIDNINIMVNGKPEQERDWYPSNGFQKTDDTSINHLGFSFRAIEPVFQKMKANGVEVVKEIAVDTQYGFKSFFVRNPDKVLVEIVEEKPIPNGIWDK